MDDSAAAAAVRASPALTSPRRPADDREKRTSRACWNCRRRKSACRLSPSPVVDGVVTTPCDRCKAAGLDCEIGTSNRGGRRVRKKPLDQTGHANGQPSNASSTPTANGFTSGTPVYPQATNYEPPAWPEANANNAHGTSRPATALMTASPAPGMMIDPVLQASDAQARGTTSDAANLGFDDLQNTSDALGILAQIASHGEHPTAFDHQYSFRSPPGQSLANYPLVRDRKLSGSEVTELVTRYRRHYHPFYPLVPSATLNTANLAQTSQAEPHLLTAILVIASRDISEAPQIFTACSEHMKSLVSALSAGGDGGVEAVEALLLLAEWTAYTSRSDAGNVGRGEEDREAWMHIGLALRIAYFLGLDRYAFTRGDDNGDQQWRRKQLCWTACYMSDRGISIRIGRAFWSRGPGPLNNLRKEDFPTLRPSREGDEDLASIFQARLELTLLFSNVHDVLYSNPGMVSMRNHLSASSYVKFIDDFRAAIYGWKARWSPLKCDPALKACLDMSYEYLRLYNTAFAFHSVVKRSLSQQQQTQAGQAPPLGQALIKEIGGIGDSRFVYEGLDAAKSILQIVVENVDPETALRYMPLRFYLYSVYAGVFLYRARSVGILKDGELLETRQLIAQTVETLRRAAVGPQHPGGRYSQLLGLLWDKVDRQNAASGMISSPESSYTLTPGGTNVPLPHSSRARSKPEPSATTEIMGDFTWTDLGAIGNFALNGNMDGLNMEFDMSYGFLPADTGNLGFDDLAFSAGGDFGNMTF